MEIDIGINEIYKMNGLKYNKKLDLIVAAQNLNESLSDWRRKRRI